MYDYLRKIYIQCVNVYVSDRLIIRSVVQPCEYMLRELSVYKLYRWTRPTWSLSMSASLTYKYMHRHIHSQNLYIRWNSSAHSVHSLTQNRCKQMNVPCNFSFFCFQVHTSTSAHVRNDCRNVNRVRERRETKRETKSAQQKGLEYILVILSFCTVFNRKTRIRRCYLLIIKRKKSHFTALFIYD